jgi:multidrug efflux pump subunit AcrB
MKNKKYIESYVYNLLHSRKKKIITLLVLLFTLVSSIMLVTSTMVKVKLLPKDSADFFSIYIDLPEGKSVYETREVTSCIIEQLKNEETISNISVFLGESAPIDFSGMIKGRIFTSGDNIANMLINLSKASERSENSMLITHRLRPFIQENCSYHNANIKMIEFPAGPPAFAALSLEVSSNTQYAHIESLAYQLESIFAKTTGLADVDVTSDNDYKKYSVVLKRNKILESKLQLEQVKKILYIAFEGVNIAFSNDANAENQIPVHLVLNTDTKLFTGSEKTNLLKKFSEIKLMNQNGLLVPLSELVEIKSTKNDHKLMSKNLLPLVIVTAETDMESQIYPLLSIRNEIKKTLSSQYTVEENGLLDLILTDNITQEKYNLHWDGEQKLSMDTITDLSSALGVAIVMIFFMMVVYYKNFSLAGAIILSSFLSITGVVYAHLIFDIFTPETFYMTGPSLIGFIALIGINSRNSLLIIDFAKQLIHEKQLSVERAIAISIQTRAKPILLTVLAIVFASALLATDIVFGGLGVALIGGTLAAYIVSLFIVPIMIHKALLKQYPNSQEE